MWWHHWWHHRWHHWWRLTGFWTHFHMFFCSFFPFWSFSEFMNTTMSKTAPTSDLFHVFLSFYPHKNKRKSVKWASVRIRSSVWVAQNWFIVDVIFWNWSSNLIWWGCFRVLFPSLENASPATFQHSVGSSGLGFCLTAPGHRHARCVFVL